MPAVTADTLTLARVPAKKEAALWWQVHHVR